VRSERVRGSAWAAALMGFAISAQWLAADEPAEQNVAELSKITVTATRSSRNEFDVPAAVNIVSPDKLGRRALTSAIDALEDELGIIAQRTTNGQGSPAIRGLTGYHTLILIDGVRLSNSTFRSGPNQYFNTLNIDDIDRIELVRGPSAVAYGNSALGGVIAVTTRQPSVTSELTVEPRLFGRWRSASDDRIGGVSVSGSSHDMGFLASFTRKSVGDVQPGAGRDVHVKGRKFLLTSLEEDAPQPGDKLRSGGKEYVVTRVYDEEAPTSYTESAGNASVSWQPTEGSSLRAGYQGLRQVVSSRWDKIGSGEEYDLLTFDPQERHLAHVTYESNRLVPGIDQIAGTLSLHRQIEGSSSLKVGKDPATDTSRIEDTVDTIGASIRGASSLSDTQRLTVGAEVYRDAIESEQVLPKVVAWGRFPDGSDALDASGFAQYEMSLSPGALIFAGNVTHYEMTADLSLRDPAFGVVEKSGNAATGTVSGSVRVIDGLRVYASAGSGFRAPSLDDLSGVQVTNQSVSAPSPGVLPERSLNAEVGLKAQTSRLSGSLTVFQNDLRDQMVARRVSDVYGSELPQLYRSIQAEHPQADITVIDNLDRTRIRGIEAEAAVALPHDATVYALGSITRGSVLTIDGNDPDPAKPWQENIRREPPASGTVGVRWMPQGARRWVETFVRGAAKQDRLSAGDISDPRIPGYTRDASAVQWDGRRALDAGTPGWFTWNVRGGVTIGGVTASVGVENILNRRYRVHGSGVDAPGRDVIVSIENRF